MCFENTAPFQSIALTKSFVPPDNSHFLMMQINVLHSIYISCEYIKISYAEKPSNCDAISFFHYFGGAFNGKCESVEKSNYYL